MNRTSLWTLARRAIVGSVVVLISHSVIAEDTTRGNFSPDAWARQMRYEAALVGVPDATSLRAAHVALSSVPHPAGSEGDRQIIRSLVEMYRDLGLDVEQHDFWTYLAFPTEASVEIVGSTDPLPVTEAPVVGDPYVEHPDLLPGFNAYSGSGDVTAEVVYANRGTKADFAILERLGIDCTGKIVVARYGGNFRGFKAKFAEEAGAAGLIIYTDPADSGYGRGPMYPDGGWANPTSIQRGSIKTLPYPGDPLTPFVEATEDAERLDPADVPFSTIPVQPVGWVTAERILQRMQGDVLPTGLRGSWQGGLPFAYRLTGGEGLQVRLRVQQDRRIVRTANVVASIRGATAPDELVILGCHHDAWTFGAGDPNAGSIVLYEIARSFALAARAGWQPDRTIVFANWGAEEYGIIGSTEWVESRLPELTANGIAYINLDMAAMGPNFGSSASPLLKGVIADATTVVPQSGDDAGRSVREAWAGDDAPRFGNLGGGSDHVGFYCHACLPCASIGARGSDGVSYHSGYESLSWYWKVVGEDYGPAVMVSQVGAVVAARLANGTTVPFDLPSVPRDVLAHLRTLEDLAVGRGMPVDLADLKTRAGAMLTRAEVLSKDLSEIIGSGRLSASRIRGINTELRQLERAWHSTEGLPGRPWFRSLYAATDPNSGYASWMLPGLRLAIETEDAAMVASMRSRYGAALANFSAGLDRIRAFLE